MSEAVVQEIRKLLIVHPILVLASKTAHLVDKNSANEVKRLVARIRDLFVTFAPSLCNLKQTLHFQFLSNEVHKMHLLSAQIGKYDYLLLFLPSC